MSSISKKRGYVPPTGAQLVLKRSAQECGLDDRNLRSHFTSPPLFPDLQWHSNGSIWKLVEEEEQEEQEGSLKDASGTVAVVDPSNAPSLSGTGASVGSTSKITTDAAPAAKVAIHSSSEQQPTVTKRPASTVYLIQKGREMHLRMQTSPQYLRTNSSSVLQRDPAAHGNASQTNSTSMTQSQSLLQYYYPGLSISENPSDDATHWLSNYLPDELVRPTSSSLKSTTRLNKDPSLGTLASPPASKSAKHVSLEDWEAREAQRTKRGRATATITRRPEDAEDAHPDQEEEEEGEEAEDYTTNYYESEGEVSGGSGGEQEPTF